LNKLGCGELGHSIVVNNVQFFESLFAKVVRCRKLHNLASVIIFDEVNVAREYLDPPCWSEGIGD
jgi:hypothetical protein